MRLKMVIAALIIALAITSQSSSYARLLTPGSTILDTVLWDDGNQVLWEDGNDILWS